LLKIVHRKTFLAVLPVDSDFVARLEMQVSVGH
jgi:hypothetical protein